MHFLYALVRKSSFSKAQGFAKAAPERGVAAVSTVGQAAGRPRHSFHFRRTQFTPARGIIAVIGSAGRSMPLLAPLCVRVDNAPHPVTRLHSMAHYTVDESVMSKRG